MKITRLETLRLGEFPNLVWLRLHTDQGVSGLGETSYAAQSVEAYLHEYVAPRVLGRDPLELEALTRSLTGYLGWRGSGVETRAASAFDLALWDLYGKVCNQPLYQVLGGASRERDPHLQHLRRLPLHPLGRRPEHEELGPRRQIRGAVRGPRRFPAPRRRARAFASRAGHHRHEDLAVRSVCRGERRAVHLGPDLDKALEPFPAGSAPRSATAWTSWSSSTRCGACPAAQKIARALAEFDTFWHEDPIRMDSLALLKQYAPHSKAPICASEILAGRWSFKDLLETGVAGIVMFDLAWCGGISEARRIAALADAWQLPVAPHDCTGPLVYAASVHFSIHAPNALVQESVRAFYTGWYNELVTHVPKPVNGLPRESRRVRGSAASCCRGVEAQGRAVRVSPA